MKTSLENLTSLDSVWSNGKRVLGLSLKQHRKMVLGLFSLSVVSSVLPYIQLGVFGLIVNEVIGLIASSEVVFSTHLIELILAEALLLFLPSLVASIDSSVDTIFRFRFLESLTIIYNQKLADIDIATYEDSEFHNKLNSANERGVFAVYNLWGNQRRVFQDIIGVISAGIILSSFHWIFLLLSVFGALPQLLIEIKHGTRVFWIWDHDAEKRRLFFDRRWHFMEKKTLTELKLFQNVPFFMDSIKSLLSDFTAKQVSAERKRVVYEVLSTIVYAVTLTVSVFILIKLTLTGALLVGTMTFVFGSIRAFQGTLGSFFRNFGHQEENNRFVGGIFEILDTENAIPASKNPKPIDVSKPPKIEFRDVWFKYPSSTQWVLKGFSLTIEPGENLSLVGVNGAGKTTFVKLLNRFYDPSKGSILVNGVDLRELDIEKWREMSSVLFQEYATYNFPVKEAVAIGRTSIPLDEKRVRDATDKSESTEFIEKLEGGYEQMIGKHFTGGVELSVGQNQKMALARVFYRKAQLVILDEPTASIDAESEAHIFEQIHEEMREKTVITISHRFSTVKQSDKICVIKDGSVSEYGTHEKLMLGDSDYARLYSKQASAYQD